VAGGEADLGGFVETAGHSLVSAQSDLAGEALGVPAAVAIAEAELEVKATVGKGPEGEMTLQPISNKEAREAQIDPGLLSTLRVRYVAVTEDSLAQADRPRRKAEAVIAEVSKRDDVAALDQIVEGLSYEATFVSSARHWLVTAHDPQDQVVRVVTVADARGRARA
jgi:hypothetical protein